MLLDTQNLKIFFCEKFFVTKTQRRISGELDVKISEGLGLEFFVDRVSFLLSFEEAVILFFAIVSCLYLKLCANFAPSFRFGISRIQFVVEPSQIKPVVVRPVTVDMINLTEDVRARISNKVQSDQTMYRVASTNDPNLQVLSL